MRLVRSLAERYKFMSNKVGMVGFSAGGHLAAMLGVTYDDGNPNSPDPVERYSDKPNFLVLAYPWLNAMQPNDQGMITYCSVLKDIAAEQCRSYEQRYTPLLHVTGGFPKTFLYITSDDRVVSVSGSIDFFQALIAAGVSAELHVFHHGEHASGFVSGDRALDMWPTLMDEWLREGGFLAGWSGWGEQSREDAGSRLTVK
jgi:acetyl esterase/lipase